MEIAKKILRRGKRLTNQIIGRDLRYFVQIKTPKEYLGTEYNGWCICPINISKASVIYSFGVGEDISFDLSMIEKFGVNIYAFDPTPRSISWVKSQKLPETFKLFEY